MKSWVTWVANLGILLVFVLAANALADGVTASKFAITPATPITYTQVQPVLAACASCHAGYDYPAIADFGKFPFVAPEKWARGEDNTYWIRRIAKRMDLANQGKFASMPPTWAYETSKEDIELVTRWIRGGAMDPQGSRVLSEEQVATYLDR